MILIFVKKSGIGKPSIFHALVIIFLEYFAWSILTLPIISVSLKSIVINCLYFLVGYNKLYIFLQKLNNTFQDHALLMNGIIWGIKVSRLIQYC